MYHEPAGLSISVVGFCRMRLRRSLLEEGSLEDKRLYRSRTG
ncbi:hypothetical protein OOU_Y34scaffold00165g11 [Pyricularia oryzae Y34]|uniref:Uncharacterized protein n=2 Tax=Pyricularia oryzae TaxID=318829 RepID=A0AA97PQI1_PYRO3|nr:hypothetical protein OOU_Y34scaffold00165g11 [Pyricularia oryzae Y34]